MTAARLHAIYHRLPAGLRETLRPITPWVRRQIDPALREREAWLRDDYIRAGNDSRAHIFLSIARFCHINRPIEGYYFEFGCHSARTMKLAWKHTRHLFNWTYVGFDSFEGLPEIERIDRQQIWEKGKLKTAEEEFVREVVRAGMPRDRLMTIKGFYDQSLTPTLAQSLLPRKAAVIYVDSDLYASAVPVLRFIRPFLQTGTIIVFDDWNCFHGDPDKGERRAWAEFTRANADLRFEPFVATSEAQSFIHLGERTDG